MEVALAFNPTEGMDPRKIFQQYRAERRGQAYTGFTLQLLPHLSRYVPEIKGADGFVAFADLAAESLADTIQEQVAFFDGLRQNFEWKVYDFDSPGNLRDVLAASGFVPGDTEAFLVADAKSCLPSKREIPGLDIRRVTGPLELRDFVRAEQSIWPEHDLSWHIRKYTEELARDPSAVSLYCAYLNEQPVGTGRVSLPPHSAFAELNGGGVVASARGRGIFTALLNQRTAEAIARGYPWLAVDAAPMSRPILLRKGFQHVCWTYPMMHRVGSKHE